MNEFGKRLEKNIEEAKRILVESKAQNIKKLEQLSEEIKKGFDERIEKMSRKRNLLIEALQNRLKMKRWKISLTRSILETKAWVIFKNIVSMPFIYGLFFPTAVFHFFLELYHQVSFRLYGIPLVRMDDYFVFDRGFLSYLNWLEKLDCFYCSYFNCLISYAQEIGGRTERFWCPIKHARKMKGVHAQYSQFIDYLDAEDFQKKRRELRRLLREELRQEEKNRNAGVKNS